MRMREDWLRKLTSARGESYETSKLLRVSHVFCSACYKHRRTISGGKRAGSTLRISTLRDFHKLCACRFYPVIPKCWKPSCFDTVADALAYATGNGDQSTQKLRQLKTPFRLCAMQNRYSLRITTATYVVALIGRMALVGGSSYVVVGNQMCGAVH